MRNPLEKDRPIVILPFKYLEEVRRAPDSRLSLPKHLEKVRFSSCFAYWQRPIQLTNLQNSILNHIGGPEVSDEVIQAAKLKLNRALGESLFLLKLANTEDC